MNRSDSGRTIEPPSIISFGFKAMLVTWLILPVALFQNYAQDAVPYLVAGEFVIGDEPAEVYASDADELSSLSARFAARACELSPPGTDCDAYSVAFVSTPVALPFAVVVHAIGPDLGVLVMRLIAAGCFVGGMALIWERLVHRHRRAGHYLLACAVLMTPFVMIPTTLGQTSPLLFLSAALGVSGTDSRRRAVVVAGVFSALVAFKLFPIALVAVMVWQRRWRLIAWVAAWLGALTAMAILVVPTSVFGAFSASLTAVRGGAQGNPYNASLANAVRELVPGAGTDLSALVVAALAAGVIVVIWFKAARFGDDDTQWSFGFVLVLLVVPLVWWHYIVVAIPALAIAVAGQQRIRIADLRVLAVGVAVTAPISIVNYTVVSPAMLGVKVAYVAGVVAALVALARRQRTPAMLERPVLT